MSWHPPAALVAASVPLSVASSPEGQSLADVAKKEQDRRGAIKAGKVYTNSSLRPESPAPPAPANVSPSAPAPSTTPSHVGDSDVAAMSAKATAAYGPTLLSLSRVADSFLANYQRYDDACYRKVTRVTTQGSSVGSGSASAAGAIAGRDWAGLWAAEASFGWREDWAKETNLDNASTSRCRSLWSDIQRESDQLQAGIDQIEDSARRIGIFPGVVRDLRSRYGLVW